MLGGRDYGALSVPNGNLSGEPATGAPHLGLDGRDPAKGVCGPYAGYEGGAIPLQDVPREVITFNVMPFLYPASVCK